MRDLFSPVTRDERQDECKRAWLTNKGRGTIEACTGFGFVADLTGLRSNVSCSALFCLKSKILYL